MLSNLKAAADGLLFVLVIAIAVFYVSTRPR